MPSNDSPAGNGWGRIANAVGTLVQTRIALFGIELAEEKDRLFGALVLVACIGVVGLLALLCLTALIVIGLWDSYRWWPLLILTIVYGLIALVCLLRLRHTIRFAPPAFEATRAEFDQDRTLIEQHFRDRHGE